MSDPTDDGQPAIDVERAAALLWRHWRRGTRMAALPDGCRPSSRVEGYAVQAALVAVTGQRVAGWKIAATSVAGQRHIGVDGPLAGRLLAGRVLAAGARVSLSGNGMRVAEAEFAFRFARNLDPDDADVSTASVLDAVGAVLPAIEIPDSRFDECLRAGAPQLIADMACASWVTFGEARPPEWCTHDLAGHAVTAFRNGGRVADGRGANALGDPRIALTWLVNELRLAGAAIHAGDVVITGTCVPPVPIVPGDHVVMDFGTLGVVRAEFEGE